MRIVHVTSSLDGGGIASLLFEYCSRMKKNINFDFILTAEKEGILENKFRNMGCRIYHIPQLRKNPYGSIKSLYQILKNNKYDIIHAHGDYRSFNSLLIAKILGIKNRIVHSHLAYIPETLKQKIERKIFVPLVKMISTQLMACGKDAAIWMWGKNDVNNGRVFIMANAIDTKKFLYNEDKRIELRKKYKIKNNLVIGNVARFSFQKNHIFLLEIFKEILELKKDAVLVLIGDGELRNEILLKIEELQISRNVLILGTLDNVNEYLNFMDVFVLPTRYEGLGIVYIEAQVNGLKCFATDKVVPKEVNICGNICFVAKEVSAKEWALKILNENIERDFRAYEKVFDTGYDIDRAALNMEEYYISL